MDICARLSIPRIVGGQVRLNGELCHPSVIVKIIWFVPILVANFLAIVLHKANSIAWRIYISSQTGSSVFNLCRWPEYTRTSNCRHTACLSCYVEDCVKKMWFLVGPQLFH